MKPTALAVSLTAAAAIVAVPALVAHGATDRHGYVTTSHGPKEAS